MNRFNFTELMRKVHAITEPNAKELQLWRALAVYEQNVLYADDYLMKVKSEIGYLQKERELLALSVLSVDEIRPKSNNLKISTCLIFELLRLVGKGRDVNDLTTLAQFASIITGFSKITIVNTMQEGFNFSERYHGAVIREANEVLRLLGVPVALEVGGRY